MLLALSAGFLCVISLLSTFLRPLVTSSPRLRSAKTADTPPAAGVGAAVAGGGGGPGGGGGGGAPPAAAAEGPEAWYSLTDFPWYHMSLHVVSWTNSTYIRVPAEASRVMVHNIFPKSFEERVP